MHSTVKMNHSLINGLHLSTVFNEFDYMLYLLSFACFDWLY